MNYSNYYNYSCNRYYYSTLKQLANNPNPNTKPQNCGKIVNELDQK